MGNIRLGRPASSRRQFALSIAIRNHRLPSLHTRGILTRPIDASLHLSSTQTSFTRLLDRLPIAGINTGRRNRYLPLELRYKWRRPHSVAKQQPRSLWMHPECIRYCWRCFSRPSHDGGRPPGRAVNATAPPIRLAEPLRSSNVDSQPAVPCQPGRADGICTPPPGVVTGSLLTVTTPQLRVAYRETPRCAT